MWMNPYVEDTLIRERLAEAQREGGRRQLVRSAGSATAPRHPWAFLQHLAEAISTLWPKSGKERMVDAAVAVRITTATGLVALLPADDSYTGGPPTRRSAKLCSLPMTRIEACCTNQKSPTPRHA